MIKTQTKIEVDKKAKTVILSTAATLMGSEINQWKLDDLETMTFDFTMKFDIDELVKIVAETGQAIHAVEPERLKAAIREVVVECFKGR